jgi:AcrR family transcriptional regulator
MNDQIPLANAVVETETSRCGRRDAAENRRRLLETAERLFAEHGVESVNMADVAQEASLGKGTLYRNFANKGELCLALMDTQLKEFQDQQLADMRHMTTEQVPYLEQLGQFLESLVAFTEVHMPLLCEVQQYSESLDAGDVQRPHFWQYMTVYGLIRKAVEAGELPEELDSAYVAEALLAPLAVHTFRFQRQTLNFSLERISAGLRTLLDGLGCL